jgi:peptidoglycan/LPS O-acetylase OafA/YrhL
MTYRRVPRGSSWVDGQAILVGMQRRADIEGLRAVAVLAVLLFHAGIPGLAGGYVGVDVFFVVSGFLITSLLVSEKESRGTISLSSFYARRVRRLLPVSAVVAVTTLMASWIWLEPLRLRSVANDVLAVATFSSNFVFASRGADYLQSTLPPSPLQHYWSLAVEEQFYVVWPVLIAVICLGATATSRVNVRVRIALLSAVVAVVSFALCMRMMDSSQPWAFFSPHTRAFELAIGALVAVIPMVTLKWFRSLMAIAAWCGLIGIIVTVVQFDETTRFPGPWALAPVLATAVVLRGGNATSWAPVAVLQLSPLQWLGSRSYSAYLWHWPILIVVAAAFNRELSVIDGLVCIAIALGLSEFSFRFIENPVRHNISLRGLRAVALATAIIAVVAGAGVIARNNPPAIAVGPDATTPNVVSDTTLPAGVVETTTTLIPTAPNLPSRGQPVQAIVEAASMTGLPGNLTPGLQRAISDMPIIYNNNCHAGFSAIRPKNCVFGNETSPIVVGLYGDSHAAQWFPAFEKVAIKRNWKLITYTKRGCPPAEIPTFSSVLGKVYKECAPWRRNVLDQMVTDGVQVVFVAQFERLLSASTRKPMWQKEWREGLQGTLTELESRGIKPVLMEDTPYPGQDVPTCLSRSYTNIQQCSPSVRVAYRDDMNEMLVDFDRAGQQVLWVRNWFCITTSCPTVVGNVLVYRDDNHMTVSFASLIAPLLDAATFEFVDWYSRTP